MGMGRVQRHGDGTRLPRREQPGREVVPGVAEQRDALPAVGAEGGRELQRIPSDLGPAPRAGRVDDGKTILGGHGWSDATDERASPPAKPEQRSRIR